MTLPVRHLLIQMVQSTLTLHVHSSQDLCFLPSNNDSSYSNYHDCNLKKTLCCSFLRMIV
jgi:hypothetical protein